jgi:hypothetical protein
MKKPTNTAKAISAGESSNAILTPFAWLDDVYNRHLHPRNLTIFDLPAIQRKRVMFKAGVIVLMATALVGGCSL